MELWIDFGWLILGLVMLYFGAEWLVQGAASVALKVGLTPLVVGLTVVAFGTSAPELLVSLQANLEDPPRGGFALGNIIGSNICNIALILGVAALVRPIQVNKQVLTRDTPIMIIISLAFVWMLRDQSISTVEAAILAGTLLLYIVTSIRKGLKSGEEAEVEGMDDEEIAAAKNASGAKVFVYILLIILGLATLAVGANRLIEGGVGIAQTFGVPDVVIALSLVALGTSLPELATSIVASVKKQGDIIIGNVVGSNLFNILAVIGITGLVAPLFSEEIKSVDLYFMIGLSVLSILFMATRKTIGRLEGVILLALYVGYLASTFQG